MGAMDPSILQYARSPFAPAFHTGALRVTADTGSPMDDTGMLLPSLSTVQSISVMTLFSLGAGNFDPAAEMAGAAPAFPCPHSRMPRPPNNTISK